jgi:hypothetical protein
MDTRLIELECGAPPTRYRGRPRRPVKSDRGEWWPSVRECARALSAEQARPIDMTTVMRAAKQHTPLRGRMLTVMDAVNTRTVAARFGDLGVRNHKGFWRFFGNCHADMIGREARIAELRAYYSAVMA